MSGLNRNSAVSGHYKIVDALKALVFLVVAAIGIGFAIYLIYYGITQGSSMSKVVVIASILFIVGLASSKIFLTIKDGFIVDVEADTLEYPGGGIAADSVLSYLSPAYWLQWFRRYTLAISEIREVEVYSERKTRVSDSGKVSSSTTHYLDINGEFGAIQFSFMTKGKRDELYSLLVQMNQMGKPILNR